MSSLSSVVLLSASLGTPIALAPGATVDPVRCGPEGRFSYALYVPKAFEPGRTWPILYVFDPRSRGRFALELFREAAERHGFLIASSNDTRSDTDDARPSLLAVQAMWEDTHRRLPLAAGRALAAGFSGGARLATVLGAAAHGELFGVFAAGAGFSNPNAIPKDTPFVVFGAAGRYDFNYYELRALDQRLGELGVPREIEFFDDVHTWPPADVIERGLDWLELQAMRRGRRSRDEAWLAAWERGALARAADLEARGLLLEAAEAYRDAAEALEGLRASEAAAGAARLEARAEVRRERTRRADLDRREQAWIAARYRLLNGLMPVVGADPDVDAGRDGPPALNELLRDMEVERLRREAQTASDPYTRAAWRRRIERLYIQARSTLPRLLLAQGEFARAATSLGVAVALKPDSVPARYDLACALARGGRRKDALAELQKAVEAGFQDGAHMAEDEDLKALRELPEFQALLKQLRPAAP